MTFQRIRKAVIPAAGLGTRFLPVTKSVPKEMVPIIDTPTIQLIVEEAVNAGIEEIVLITARHKESIENHFDHNYELEDTLTKKGKRDWVEGLERIASMAKVISIRQKNPLGLGHAVLCAQPIIGDEPFAVLLGDDLIDAQKPAIGQLVEVSRKHGMSSVAVMEVPKNETQKYGVVSGTSVGQGLWRLNGLVEKPKPEVAPSNLAIPGRYVLDSAIFEILRNVKPGAGGEIQLTDGLQVLAQKQGLLAYEFHGRRYDAGDRLGYIEATLAYSLKRPELRDSVLSLMKRTLKEEGAL